VLDDENSSVSTIKMKETTKSDLIYKKKRW
jgi:hypothetical protein